MIFIHIPGRALIHVFKYPYAMEGYLSWFFYFRIFYYLGHWKSLHPISTYFVILCDPICIHEVASALVSSTTLCSL